ncbi:unnamed protein product [Boreogadus saida]
MPKRRRNLLSPLQGSGDRGPRTASRREGARPAAGTKLVAAQGLEEQKGAKGLWGMAEEGEGKPRGAAMKPREGDEEERTHGGPRDPTPGGTGEPRLDGPRCFSGRESFRTKGQKGTCGDDCDLTLDPNRPQRLFC